MRLAEHLANQGSLKAGLSPPTAAYRFLTWDSGAGGGGARAVEGGCRRLNGVSVASPGLKTSIAFLLPGPGIGPQGAEDLA